jgi:hypothetical protein
MVSAGGFPKCATCGSDEDDVFVGGSTCSFVAPKVKFPKLNFEQTTDNLARLIGGDDDLFTGFRKSLAMTEKQFEFYLDNLRGVRKVDEEHEDGETCNYCGSGLIANGECQKCGL